MFKFGKKKRKLPDKIYNPDTLEEYIYVVYKNCIGGKAVRGKHRDANLAIDQMMELNKVSPDNAHAVYAVKKGKLSKFLKTCM